jgi:hypothetical protein
MYEFMHRIEFKLKSVGSDKQTILILLYDGREQTQLRVQKTASAYI